MKKFSELEYTRPDYEKEKSSLLRYKDELETALSYKEFRNLWLSRKESNHYMDMQEELAYIRFLIDTSNEFYKEEVRIADFENPHITLIRKACDKVLLDSPYVNEIRSEFGDKIINDLKNNNLLVEEKATPLQIEENRLKTEYVKLVSTGINKEEISVELDNLFDQLINVRTNMAKSLGFESYVEMAYRVLHRSDYGRKDIFSFRSQVLDVITPAVYKILKEDNPIEYPVPNGGIRDVVCAVKNMFHEISKESGYFFDLIYNQELLDLDSRPNKRSNYWSCCMLPYYKVPFILGSYKGNGNDVNSLIHELGHGFAFYTAAHSHKLYEYHRSTVSINEVHSKTMEFFAYPYLDCFFKEKKNLYIRKHFLEALQYIPYRCAIDEYEHAVYETISLTKSQRCELWYEIEQKYMPWSSNGNQKSLKQRNSWRNQHHLFHAPFSYMDYNLAQMSAFEFYGRSKVNYQEAWKDYTMFCSKGGSTNYLNLLSAGKLTNPFSIDAVAKICTPIFNDLDSLL